MYLKCFGNDREKNLLVWHQKVSQACIITPQETSMTVGLQKTVLTSAISYSQFLRNVSSCSLRSCYF